MNYQKIYNDLILRARSEKRNKAVSYFERHHIIPKSLGGTNNKDNLVLLTAREHYIAHKLLVKIYESDKISYYKMYNALHRFLYSKNSNIKITSRDYELIKKTHREAVSFYMKGRRCSDEARKNMSLAQQKYFKNNPGHWTNKKHSAETKQKMSIAQSGKNNPAFGKSRPEEIKQKISNTMKGHKKSLETIEKFKNRKMDEDSKLKISEGLKKYHERKKRFKIYKSKMGKAVFEPCRGNFNMVSRPQHQSWCCIS